MLNKQAKIQVLENYYALDKLMFGKHIRATNYCDESILEYITTKASLLSVVVEIMRLLEYTPETKNKGSISSKLLSEQATKRAKNSREKALLIISSDKGKDNIISKLREDIIAEESNNNIRQIVENEIRSYALSTAIDHLILTPVIRECKNLKQHSTWEGRIIEDSYKILRDSLVDVATTMISDNEEG